MAVCSTAGEVCVVSDSEVLVMSVGLSVKVLQEIFQKEIKYY